jgi:aspartyl-tRNA synthetase
MSVPLSERVAIPELGPEDEGREVVVAGWIEETRDLGGIAFVQVREGTDTGQVVLRKKKVDEDVIDTFLETNRESVVAVHGTVQETDQAPGGFEILPDTVDVLNEADAPLPMGVVDRVDTELETRIDNRFIDLRSADVQSIFKIRAAALEGGRQWLLEENFTEITSPNIIGAASEGGTDVFEVQYFEDQAYLSQSPQLYKQMMMGTGLDRVFEIAKYFRAETHNTTRHLNESSAFDCEIAFVEDEDDVLWVLENLVHAITSYVDEHCTDELETLDHELTVPETPFPRVTYDEALDWTEDLVEEEVPWGKDLSTEAEKALGEIMQDKGHEYYFITKYPDECKPFYAMPEPGTDLSRSFDLGKSGMEVTSGAQRVHDPDLLEQRIEAMGVDKSDFEDYLKPFDYGMPPHGGFGLGLERIVMEMLDLSNIREAVLFPRDRDRLTP